LDTNLKANSHDESSKKGNKLVSTTLGTLLIIFIFTVISIGIYTPIKDYAFKDETARYLESNEFNYTLAGLSRYLILTNLQNVDTYHDIYDNLENIKYLLKSDSKDVVVSNLQDKSIEAEISESQFYLHIKTDDLGNITIESSPDYFKKNIFMATLRNMNLPGNLANLDIVYTIPNVLTNNDDLIAINVKNFIANQYLKLILIIGLISIIVLIILALSIPYSSQKQASIIRLFNNMYLELKFLTWFAFFVACSLNIMIANSNINNFNYFEIIYDADYYFYIIGIPLTFVLCLLIYLSICYTKSVYYARFKEGVIKNSIFGRLCLNLFNYIKKTLDQIIDVDITKDYNKKLLILLGVNLIALFIIALTGGFGLLLALAYTVFLFNYLLKALDQVRALNEASSKLAEGNFDIVVPEDMGVLSPFSRSLNNIKEGFKVAVEQEVKSQNMKTQLISNVSHDLKTPLTSIITYIDLLKKEDLEKETQKQYIDILDKKSKRLKVLIDDLFEASKASSGNIELHLKQVDVIALLRQTLGEMEERINESTLQIRTNLPQNKVNCELDGARTYRVFENIISNILKYSMTNSRVYIDVEEQDKEVSFIFKNISSYEMNFDSFEITERFTRGDESRHTEGSGLGLAIAKSLVELQNGSLDIIIDGDLFKLMVTFPKA